MVFTYICMETVEIFIPSHTNEQTLANMLSTIIVVYGVDVAAYKRLFTKNINLPTIYSKKRITIQVCMLTQTF